MLYNPDSTVLLETASVLLRPASGGEPRSANITCARPASAGIVLMYVEGVSDRGAAELLRNAIVCVPRATLPEPEDDEFYVHDVIGAAAVLVDGTPIGTVVEIRSYPSADVVVIEGSGKQYEVPLLDDFVESVDSRNKRVVLHTVEGLETT